MDTPVNIANVAPGTALPAANANILSADIAPSKDSGALRIYVCLSIAGVLSVSRTVSATARQEALNEGDALVAGAGYMFSVPWLAGETINLWFSATGGTITKLQIDEAWG